MDKSESNKLPEGVDGKPREINLFAWYGTIAGLCLIIILGPLLVLKSYHKKHWENYDNWRPGKIGRLEDNLEATNRDGKTVQLKELEGKVYVVGYQYTDCPGGCLGMASVMKELLEMYGDSDKFHLVSISCNPEEDNPEKMDAWVKDKGVDSDKWWFLTGDPEVIEKYMVGQLKLIARIRNTDPAKILAEGKWAHDQRLVIVDEAANIRGYYGVMDPVGGPTAVKLLHRDLDMVINKNKTLKDYEPIVFPGKIDTKGIKRL